MGAVRGGVVSGRGAEVREGVVSGGWAEVAEGAVPGEEGAARGRCTSEAMGAGEELPVEEVAARGRCRSKAMGAEPPCTTSPQPLPSSHFTSRGGAEGGGERKGQRGWLGGRQAQAHVGPQV